MQSTGLIIKDEELTPVNRIFIKGVVILTFLLLILAIGANAQRKQYSVIDTTIMNQMNTGRFDIEYFEKNKDYRTWNYSTLEFSKKDGTKIEQTKYIDDYFFEKDETVTSGYKERENKILRPLGIYNDSYYMEKETPPNPKLYTIYREYYLNGNLKKEGVSLRGDLPVSIWREYDENGNLVKETNWDEAYGEFDYNKVILFLDKKGHISIKTGKGRDQFTIGVDNEKHCWDVNVWPSAANNFKGFEYLLDLDTGKVKKKGKILPSGS